MKLDTEKKVNREEIVTKIEKDRSVEKNARKEKDKKELQQNMSDTIQKVTQEVLVINTGKTKRLDEIPSNPDDLPLTFITKGVAN